MSIVCAEDGSSRLVQQVTVRCAFKLLLSIVGEIRREGDIGNNTETVPPGAELDIIAAPVGAVLLRTDIRLILLLNCLAEYRLSGSHVLVDIAFSAAVAEIFSLFKG